MISTQATENQLTPLSVTYRNRCPAVPETAVPFLRNTHIARGMPTNSPLVSSRARPITGWKGYELDASHSPNVTAPVALTEVLWRILSDQTRGEFAKQRNRGRCWTSATGKPLKRTYSRPLFGVPGIFGVPWRDARHRLVSSALLETRSPPSLPLHDEIQHRIA